MADDGEPEGALVDITMGDPDVVETDDGGAIIRLNQDDLPDPNSEHFANLAETLPEDQLRSLSLNLIELIRIDKENRKQRDVLYAEGIKRTGMGNEAPGGAAFAGASRAVHPMLLEGCVDFASRAMKELFPRGGPVKDHIPGKLTEAKIAKAKRKTALMNWQLTRQCKEFRAELEQLITQVPMGGDQYLKASWDAGRNRPDFLFVGIDEMLLPFAATNFYTAERKTHVQYLTRIEVARRIKTGMYREANLVAPSITPDTSEATKANDKVEGREDSSFNEDGLRTVYESFTIADIEDDVGPAPYIVSIDHDTGEVLAVYRNWDEQDESKEELQHFVQWPFIPWRGAYSIGLTHMIGGLSGAATGAMRALLDSAHIQNAPAGLKLKGGKIGGQSKMPLPGELAEVDGGFAVDDIRKVAMPFPFAGPSPTLFQLMEFLIDAGKSVVRTSLDEMPDMQADVPVGTTMARIEQGMVVYSAIHGRLHDAMDRLLGILHRLNALHLDDKNLEAEVGEALATRADFNGPMDVCPVSDPNIFSEVQRIAQAQTVAQRADLKPQLYDLRKVEEFVLTTLKIPGADQFLVPTLAPKEQNAVNENYAASLGRPITAFPEQDHLAHLQVHLDYTMAPSFGMLSIIAPRLAPIMLGHIAEHVAGWYASAVFEAASDALRADLGEFMRKMNDEGTSEDRKHLDIVLVQASNIALEEGSKLFAQMPAAIQHLQQIVAQFQQPAGMDPVLQIENKKIDAKAKADSDKIQVAGAKLQQEDAHHKDDVAATGAKLQQDGAQHSDQMAVAGQQMTADERIAQMHEAAETLRNNDDNAVAERLHAIDAIADIHRPASQNPNPRP